MKMTVLRTAAGSPVAPFVIKALKQISGTDVVAVDSDPLSCGFAFADRYYTVPRVGAAGFLDAMLHICREESIDLLWPDLDEELLLLSEARDRFRAVNTRLIVSEPEVIRRCTDKYATYQILRERGIPTPATWLPQELKPDTSLDYPVIVKPRSGRGSSGVSKVENPEELADALKRLPNPLVQEFVEGTEYTVDTMSDLDGAFLYCSVRQRLATDSGISVKGRTVVRPLISDLTRRILEVLPVMGPGCVQAIEGDDGVKFIEVNPRIAGGAVLSIAAGVPLLADLLRLVRGERPIGPVMYRPNILMLRYWEDTFIDESTWRRTNSDGVGGRRDGASRSVL